jgi:hypothetical protein
MKQSHTPTSLRACLPFALSDVVDGQVRLPWRFGSILEKRESQQAGAIHRHQQNPSDLGLIVLLRWDCAPMKPTELTVAENDCGTRFIALHRQRARLLRPIATA